MQIFFDTRDRKTKNFIDPCSYRRSFIASNEHHSIMQIIREDERIARLLCLRVNHRNCNTYSKCDS